MFVAVVGRGEKGLWVCWDAGGSRTLDVWYRICGLCGAWSIYLVAVDSGMVGFETYAWGLRWVDAVSFG